MVDLIFKVDVGAGYVTLQSPPRNWKDMKVQLVFDNETLQLQLQSINFEWVKKNAVMLDNYFAHGLTGGTGILEGPGLQIYGQMPGFAPVLFFDGCINTADPAFNFQNDIITCPIKESGRQDWFYDAAKGFTFEYLTSIGQLTRADYKQTPYAISTIPDYSQAMLLSISLFIIIKESVDVTAKLVSLVVRATSQSLSWLQLIGTIVEIILYMIYLVAIVKASAILMQEIADNLVQAKKTKLCMREQDLFKKGLNYLGLGFVSSIYGVGTADRYNGKYINASSMPVKIKIPDGDPADEIFSSSFARPADETSNAASYGYFEGTFSQFIQEMEMTYHAKAVVKNNICYFEEINNFNVTDAFRFLNEGVPGNTFLYPQPYGTNASEIPAVYVLKAQKDEQDLNTYNDYKGTYCIAQATPAVIHNHKNLLLQGSNIIDLPFALARRKVGYTKVEKKLMKILGQYADFLTNISNSTNHATSEMASLCPTFVTDSFSDTQIGFLEGLLTGNPAFAVGAITLGSGGFPVIPAISIPYFANDRIGWMLLSSDFIGVRKRFIGVQNGQDWFIDPNNEQGSFATTINPLLNGVFTGVVTGAGLPFGGTPFTGTVTGGVLTGTGTATSNIHITAIATGTISGQPGTFTCTVVGTASGFVFPGIGVVNSLGTSTIFTLTEGWGGVLSLMNDFHYTALIAENQWLTFKDKKFRFSINDFLRVQNKNILVTPDGKVGKFQKILWNLFDDTAENVDYRVKFKYTNNYNLKISTDGG